METELEPLAALDPAMPSDGPAVQSDVLHDAAPDADSLPQDRVLSLSLFVCVIHTYTHLQMQCAPTAHLTTLALILTCPVASLLILVFPLFPGTQKEGEAGGDELYVEEEPDAEGTGNFLFTCCKIINAKWVWGGLANVLAPRFPPRCRRVGGAWRRRRGAWGRGRGGGGCEGGGRFLVLFK